MHTYTMGVEVVEVPERVLVGGGGGWGRVGLMCVFSLVC